VVHFGWLAAGSFLGALISVLVGLPALICETRPVPDRGLETVPSAR
jgi:hypothetical protein